MNQENQALQQQPQITPEAELKQLRLMFSYVTQQRNQAQDGIASLNAVIALQQEDLEKLVKRVNEYEAAAAPQPTTSH